MTNLDNATLVDRSVRGDQEAFAQLVRSYEHSLVTLIRYQVTDPGHAEDILQETLLQAWQGICHLREPNAVGAWLLQIARNRCADFHRSTQRRTLPTEDRTLELLVNRFGRGQAPQNALLARVAEAMEEIPPAERETGRLFYLAGFSIAEIAERHCCPEGTVKRRLFHARAHLRQSLGITQEERIRKMSLHKPGTKKQPFLLRRPEITVTELEAEPFAVDCRELPWWFAIPEVGDRTWWAIYDPPDWRLTSVSDMQGVCLARIHGLECVEINVDEWTPDSGWKPSDRTMYGRVTDEHVQWLALLRHDEEGRRELYTFLDEGFEQDWGPPMPRHMADRGRFARQEDGSYRQQQRPPGSLGTGMFSLRIGEREFTCLRVLDVAYEPSEEGTLMEAYLTREGRTVLCHRYNSRHWHCGEDQRPWDERLPGNAQLVIDGVTFVHWYDCLTNLVLEF